MDSISKNKNKHPRTTIKIQKEFFPIKDTFSGMYSNLYLSFLLGIGIFAHLIF